MILIHLQHTGLVQIKKFDTAFDHIQLPQNLEIRILISVTCSPEWSTKWEVCMLCRCQCLTSIPDTSESAESRISRRRHFYCIFQLNELDYFYTAIVC